MWQVKNSNENCSPQVVQILEIRGLVSWTSECACSFLTASALETIHSVTSGNN